MSGEDEGAEEVASDVEYSAGNQVQKQKIADRMLSWRMSRGRGGETGISKNDSGEFPRNHIPLITHSQGVCQFFPPFLFFALTFVFKIFSSCVELMHLIGVVLWGAVCSVA